MRLTVRDSLHIRQAVIHNIPHFVDVPFFVFLFLEDFDPVVRQGHSKTEIETYTTFFDRPAESRHAGDIFCNGQGRGFYLMSERVGKLEVCDGIPFHPFFEITVTVPYFPVTVVEIHHGSDPVETESVKMKFL